MIKQETPDSRHCRIFNCDRRHGSFCCVDCGYKRIGSGSVDGSHSSCGHECHPRQKCVNFACRRIKHVGTVACDVGCTPCDNLAQMVLSDDFYSEVIFEYVYVGVGFYGLDKRLLYLSAGIVGVM